MQKIRKLYPLLFIVGVLLLTPLLISNLKTANQPRSDISTPTLPKVRGQTIEATQTTLPLSKSSVKVTRVIDGDTIELETGQKVRYIGINTPEIVHPTKTTECFGHEASIKNKELVEGKNVEFEKDISETDKYGRLLRYVYVDDVFVNDYLVRQGFANSSSFPPDIKFQNQFLNAEQEARQNNRGLWAICQANKNHNSSKPETTAIETGLSGCIIKGNISSGGKIYHMPGQYYYSKTQIDETKGEKWFCTEEEAQNAGWRKSLR